MEGEYGACRELFIHDCGNRGIFCTSVVYYFSSTSSIIFPTCSIYLHIRWYFIWNGCGNYLFDYRYYIIECTILRCHSKNATNHESIYKIKGEATRATHFLYDKPNYNFTLSSIYSFSFTLFMLI